MAQTAGPTAHTLDSDNNYFQISDDDLEDCDEFNDDSLLEGANVANNENSGSLNGRGPYERAWTTDATRALIHIRGPMQGMFTEGRQKRTALWLHCTRQLQKMGYRYSAAKVQKKWHNILITYTKNLPKKLQSGYVHWEFFEDMHKFLKDNKCPVSEYQLQSAARYPNQKPAGGQQAMLQPLLQPQQQLQVPQEQQQQQQQQQLSYLQQQLQQHKQPQQHQTQQQLQQPSQIQAQQRQQSPQQQPPTVTLRLKRDLKPQTPPPNPTTSARPNDVLSQFGDGNQLALLAHTAEQNLHEMKSNDDEFDEDLTQMSELQQPKIEFDVADLPLEITHANGFESSSVGPNKCDDGEFTPPPSSEDSMWWKDYFERKLEVEREKIQCQKELHREQMQFEKMALLQQEKIERLKIDAINSLTGTLQKLVEAKNRKT